MLMTLQEYALNKKHLEEAKGNEPKPHWTKRRPAATASTLMGPVASGLAHYKSPAPKITGALLAANIILSSFVLYELYLSKAARVCKGDRVCVFEYKAKALEKVVIKLKADMKKCDQSKDPQVCKKKIQNKIKSLEWRIKNFKQSAKWAKSPRLGV